MDILEVIWDETMLKGIHLGQVTTIEFLNVGSIGISSISLLAILAPLNKILSCSKSEWHCFCGRSGVWDKLLGSVVVSNFILNNPLIMLYFCNIMACGKTVVMAVCLCRGGKLVSMVSHSNRWFKCRDLNVQSQIKM